ncbi:MAG: FAD-binding protein, partial [Deinococcales bacterium]
MFPPLDGGGSVVGPGCLLWRAERPQMLELAIIHKTERGFTRLVILGHTGSITLEAIRWLRDAGVTLVQIDADARTARVQPGVRNLAISEAAAPHGLYYAPDPSSQIACTIGGNVAENSGGVHCLKYGLTVHNILQLRIVTPEGELLTIGSEALDSPGYDLMALLTGSEGMLGVVVEVTVRLLPRPEQAQVMLAAFDDVGKAGAAVGAVIAEGVIPGGLEMMDNLAIRAAEDFAHAGYPVEAAAILLCELDGTREEVAEQVTRVTRILEHHGATELRLARDEAERALFWKGRKSAFPAVGR